ncbi:MAG: DUF4962 domain-containing protein [Acidobacteriaceae bacterium]|nr:DUF4962 domain-containing protein [Acidobacteriaceae bacterium]
MVRSISSRLFTTALASLLGVAFVGSACAQDAHESLGASVRKNAKGPAPLLEEMRTLPSSVKPSLAGIHPRVYFTDAELAGLKTEAHGAKAAEWKLVLSDIRALKTPPPPPPAELRRAQNEVAMGIAEAAFAYRIEGDPKLKEAALRYMDAAVSYDIWGYSFSKPNTDLAAGHLLYGLSVGYDLLYNELTPAQRDKYRNKLARQGHLLYEAFKSKPGRVYAYSQNHTFIPMAGLGIAAYAVYGEVPEAAEWAKLARGIYQRVLQTYSHDGYYFEGYEYWIFATPWIIHYLDAQKHAAGEDLFNQPGLHDMYLYAAHDLLPGGQQMFDFGDVYEGPKSRAKIGEDYERSHPDGKFLTNYNVLYDLAREFHDPKTQGVADWMRDSLHHVNAEEWWSFVWRDTKLKSAPIASLPTYHRFPDMDVAFWRSSWSADATAVAFKCGPPEGHDTAALVQKFPDWRLEDGHVHPDVNSFILFAHGKYLTGDSGYAGVPKTIEHNTLLVDGHGQGKEGTHDAWGAIPYAQLNGIRLTRAELSARGFTLVGEGAPAYNKDLGLTRFERTLELKDSTLKVSDNLLSSKPVVYTEVLHSDTTIGEAGKLRFVIPAKDAALHVSVLAPSDAAAKVEPNIVMGPGRPGSVDKGTPEQRGERVLVSTPSAAESSSFRWNLSF